MRIAAPSAFASPNSSRLSLGPRTATAMLPVPVHLGQELADRDGIFQTVGTSEETP